MKKVYFILVLSYFILVFSACSTDVDLYVEMKDTPVVYGVLDVTNDTNVVKIIRAFSGSNDDSFDVHQIALIADSSNYPGLLDARFIEYKKASGGTWSPTGREIILDTMMLYNKPEGFFYAPNQKVYYTTEPFKVNNAYVKYKYKLLVIKSNDTISSDIGLIGGENFQISSPMVFFKAENGGMRKLLFTPDDNEAIYQVRMQFNYKELRPGQDTVYKNVTWSLGRGSTYDLGVEDGKRYFTYHEESLFNLLSEAIGNDNFNVERFYESFIVSIYAYGKELEDYIQLNAATSGIEYYSTNIHGGLGILSSCHEIKKSVDMSSRTKTDLLSKNWGFKYIGYN